MITKAGWPSVIPHQNWRGQFVLGTYATGALADCAGGETTGCESIPWPGHHTTAWHRESKAPDIRTWYGGPVDGMRDASGQMYMRNRYYDPATGQFTQPDPIGLAGGLNAYGFAAGDPVGNYDPTGLCAFGIGADAFHGRCGKALDAGEVKSDEPKRHGRCEVATLLSNYIRALRTNPFRFAAFGDRDYPSDYDYRIEQPNDLFEVGGRWLKADEFGNYSMLQGMQGSMRSDVLVT